MTALNRPDFPKDPTKASLSTQTHQSNGSERSHRCAPTLKATRRWFWHYRRSSRREPISGFEQTANLPVRISSTLFPWRRMMPNCG